jgi:hypothetical protein
LEVDAGVRTFNFDLYSKRDLCINLVPQESDVCPRSRAITASNENDLFHIFDPQLKPLGESEPAADVLHYPPAKSTLSKSVLTPSCYRQG